MILVRVECLGNPLFYFCTHFYIKINQRAKHHTENVGVLHLQAKNTRNKCDDIYIYGDM